MRSVANASRTMSLFWSGITVVMLLYLSIAALIADPVAFHQPKVFAMLLGVGIFGIWYSLGYRAIIRAAQYQRSRLPAYRIIYWLGLGGLAMLLAQVDPIYFQLLWVLFGVSLGIFPLGWNVALGTVSLALVLMFTGLIPGGATHLDWLGFIGILLTSVMMGGMSVMYALLIRQHVEREQFHQALAAAHDQLRQVHTQLAQAGERDRELAVLRDREHLAREMHDTLGHSLVLTSVKLEAIRRLLAVDQPRALREIDQTQEVVRTAMGDLRQTLATLRLPAPHDGPVGLALARYADQVGERAGWSVDCQIAEATTQWPETIQPTLWRIGTELLHNIERHAHARHVTLGVQQDGDQAVLRIADDGCGLPDLPVAADGTLTSPPGHFGLSGIVERAREVGGWLQISSQPGQGTTVVVAVPLTCALASVGAAGHAEEALQS